MTRIDYLAQGHCKLMWDCVRSAIVEKNPYSRERIVAFTFRDRKMLTCFGRCSVAQPCLGNLNILVNSGRKLGEGHHVQKHMENPIFMINYRPSNNFQNKKLKSQNIDWYLAFQLCNWIRMPIHELSLWIKVWGNSVK